MTDPNDPTHPGFGPANPDPNQGQQYPNQGQQYPNQGQQYGNQGGPQYPNQGQQYGNQGQQYGTQGQQYGTQGQQYGGPGSDVPSAPAPQQQGMGALIGIVVAMLLLGGAIGFFGGSALFGDDDDAEVVSTEAAAADTSSTTAPPVADPDLWAYPDEFQVVVPDGFKPTIGMYGPGRRALQAYPTDERDHYIGGGLAITFDRRPDMTPGKVLDELKPSEKCSTAGPREPFSEGDFVGEVATFTGCPNGFELTRVAVVLPGGSHLQITSVSTPGDTSAVTEVLSTFSTEVAADTNPAPWSGCGEIEAATDPEWPLSLQIHNHTDEEVTFGWLDQAANQIDRPEALPSAHITGTWFTKPGDKFRITMGGVDHDYTSTDAAIQCVRFTGSGFETIPN